MKEFLHVCECQRQCWFLYLQKVRPFLHWSVSAGFFIDRKWKSFYMAASVLVFIYLQIVKKFVQSPGPELQKILEKRAEERTNWVIRPFSLFPGFAETHYYRSACRLCIIWPFSLFLWLCRNPLFAYRLCIIHVCNRPHCVCVVDQTVCIVDQTLYVYICSRPESV